MKDKQHIYQLIALAIILAMLCLVSLCSSCSKQVLSPPEIIEVPQVTHHYHNTSSNDTIHQRDSVIIMQKGDTIYNNTIKHFYHSSYRCDTVYQNDTITQVKKVNVPIYIEKELTPWQQTRLKFANVTLILLGFVAGGAIFLMWRKWKKKLLP